MSCCQWPLDLPREGRAPDCHMRNRRFEMRNYLLATAALLAISTPAVAKDHSGYIGVDIGATWPKSQALFATGTFSGPVVCNALPPATCTAPTNIPSTFFSSLDYNAGLDIDAIGGYDFGMFRLEGELGYRHGH